MCFLWVLGGSGWYLTLWKVNRDGEGLKPHLFKGGPKKGQNVTSYKNRTCSKLPRCSIGNSHDSRHETVQMKCCCPKLSASALLLWEAGGGSRACGPVGQGQSQVSSTRACWACATSFFFFAAESVAWVESQKSNVQLGQHNLFN